MTIYNNRSMDALGEPARGISKLTFMIVVEVDGDVGRYREAFGIYNSARASTPSADPSSSPNTGSHVT